MWLLFLEAGIALFLLVFIVWWTMFQPKRPDRSAPPPTKNPSLPDADSDK